MLSYAYLVDERKSSEPNIKYLFEIREPEKNIFGSFCQFKSDDWRFLSSIIIKNEVMPEDLIRVLNLNKYNGDKYNSFSNLILVPNPSADVWIIRNSMTNEWSIVSNKQKIPKNKFITVFIREPY